uniref:Uncharacterized protein n=1 Tax=Oreochromis niloticus TaxID=8128 RepID=A0A669BVS0_ORENI
RYMYFLSAYSVGFCFLPFFPVPLLRFFFLSLFLSPLSFHQSIINYFFKVTYPTLIKMKGCLAVANCNMTNDVTFGTNSTVYKMTKTCCNTDLCNAAPGVPGIPTLTLALATISAVFVGNLLV